MYMLQQLFFKKNDIVLSHVSLFTSYFFALYFQIMNIECYVMCLVAFRCVVPCRAVLCCVRHVNIWMVAPVPSLHTRGWLFDWQVSDGEQSELFGGISVKVNYQVGDPKVKTKTTDSCITCSKNGVIIVGVLVAEGLIVVVLIVHACCNLLFLGGTKGTDVR